MLEAVRSVDPDDPLLPGVVVGDVRQGARGAAERGDAVLPAQPVRRRQGLRPLHHGELPRELRPVRRLGHPLQPRVAAARARVRDAQDHRRRRPHQARPGERAAPRQPRRPARLGLRRRLRARDVADAAAGRPPTTTSSRPASHAHRPRRLRGRVRPRRARLGAARRDRRALPAARGGRPCCVGDASKAERELGWTPERVVRADDGDDGRRRPRPALSAELEPPRAVRAQLRARCARQRSTSAVETRSAATCGSSSQRTSGASTRGQASSAARPAAAARQASRRR